MYFNNSPDTLKRIVIRLYQNIYKIGNAREFTMDKKAVNDGMVVEEMKINGKVADIENRKVAYNTPTNLVVMLENPLLPHDSISMEFKWHFKVSKERPIRMGNYGDNRFFITYWYPQVSVYDDINGWDMVDYLGAVEFYNDYINMFGYGRQYGLDPQYANANGYFRMLLKDFTTGDVLREEVIYMVALEANITVWRVS